MATNEYRIVTSWRVAASAREIAEVVNRPGDYPNWWPASFLKVQLLESEPNLRVGSEAIFHAKGWLPYTVRFHGVVQELVYPHKCTLRVWGDFEGHLYCDVRQEGTQCKVRFDWRVRVQKPIVRRFSFFLKPLFFSNHVWAMLRGCQSLRLELAQRRSREYGAAYDGPPPPGPTFPCGARYRLLRKALQAFSNTLTP